MNIHWQGYEDFAHYDKLAGGPDSHLKTVVELAKTFHEPLWAACLYVATYNVPMAETLKVAFPHSSDLSGLEQWIEANWPMIFRRERQRPVGSPIKLTDCLESCAYWIQQHDSELAYVETYDELWRLSSEIAYFGRYAQMKFLETLRRMGLVTPMIPDIRAKGGWSPREGLILLHPEEADLIRSNDIQAIEELAGLTFNELNNDLAKRSTQIDRYEFQVFLCDYKQVAVTQRQYPGRSLDSELKYFHLAQRYSEFNGEAMMAARGRLFPAWALGEVQGWDGVREELGTFFVNTNKMWSDSLYDWTLMMEDPYAPVEKWNARA